MHIAVWGILGSFLLGLIVSIIRHYRILVLAQVATAYIELSRNTPLLIQLFFLYFGLPRIGIVLSSEVCATLGLVFLGGSYMAESFRSGLEAISQTQQKIGLAIGLTPLQVFYYVVLPQATAVALPSFSANVIFLIKETSVFSAVALADLMYVAKDLIGLYYETDIALAMLVVAYLIMLLPISLVFSWIERRLPMQDSGIQVLFQGNNLLRILQGLGVTIGISILSVLLSMMFGTVMGIIMTSHSRIIRFLTRLYLEFIRIMPQLVLLFIVYFGLARNFNINISGETSAIIVFTLWGTAEMGDLVRGAITSLPKHQFESGQSLGLTNVQLYYHIIIPQVLRRLLPQAINLVTRMIKTTSLVVLIGVVEVTKVGQQIIDSNRLTIPTASFWIYGTILVLYFAVCYPISKLSTHLEKHWRN
ncbi:amino acid ABC transporter permease [Streptococcus pneumoniae]|nr:amino acid ABC transporter permease [Streptococcus pneumoniae]